MTTAASLALLLLAILLLIRVVGERKFRVVAASPPPRLPVPPTRLSVVVDNLLHGRGESFFYPLGIARQALAARLELAERAEQSLDIQYYLFHDDEAGQAILAAAVEAADRGVKVRVLLDDMDTKHREGILIRLAAEHENLDIRIFNPTWLRSLRFLEYIARFPRVTRRMHCKSFTVDGVASVVGGRNVGNEYFGVLEDILFEDLDVIAAGAIAQQVQGEFDAYWHSGVAVSIARLGQPASEAYYRNKMKEFKSSLGAYRKVIADGAFLRFEDEDFVPFYAAGTVIYDPPEKVIRPLYDQEYMAREIRALMASATTSLLISTPYFVPGKAGMKLFGELRKTGVEITILTNSFAANDVALVHAGYINYRRKLLKIGVRLFELKPARDDRPLALLGTKRSSLHAKSVLVDGHKIFVGSFNLDPRSAVHNTEMGVVFDNANYGAKFSARMHKYLQTKAYAVSLSKRGFVRWGSGGEKVYKTEPETSVLTRLLVNIASLLPIEWLL